MNRLIEMVVNSKCNISDFRRNKLKIINIVLIIFIININLI